MASPSSTFEMLSDEILMIIFQYSGNVTSIFRTFSRLNQRLSRILVDRRLHLLTDFLRINIRKSTFSYYYDTSIFQILSQQLFSLQDNNYEYQIDQCFQQLVAFHIQEKTRQLEDQFRLDREQFHSIRSNLTKEEIHFRDAVLKRTFNDLDSHSINFEILQKLENLTVGTGARLECLDNGFAVYNLSTALKQHLLTHLYTVGYPNRSCLYSFKRLLKALIVSNPNLIHNKDSWNYPMYSDLICAVFQFRYSSTPRLMTSSMEKYETMLELLLFIIQYLRRISDTQLWTSHCDENSLYLITSINNKGDENILIQCSQMEVFKILFHEITRNDLPLDYYSNSIVEKALKSAILDKRIDIIKYFFHETSFMQKFLSQSEYCYNLLNTIIGTRSTRKMFDNFLYDKSLQPWTTMTTMIFILVEKKECKWIKKLFRLYPTLIDRMDDDGNHPLLYVCLKANGCRHRLIELLISMGSDLQKRNKHGEHFIQAIQLKRNRQLLKKLIEHELIERENKDGQLQVVLNKQLHDSKQT
ncbi:hypothetical protein I4U23_003888 [Adineta vaga]|nr:hypothetical protein I4U23_003888 [Adineta vaga]